MPSVKRMRSRRSLMRKMSKRGVAIVSFTSGVFGGGDEHLSAGFLHGSLGAGGDVFDLDGQLLGQLALAQNLHRGLALLENPLGDESLVTHGLTVAVVLLEQKQIHRNVLDL